MRIKVYCPCGTTLLWTKIVDDGTNEVKEGIGDQADCCRSPIENPRPHAGFQQAMKGVVPLKKKG